MRAQRLHVAEPVLGALLVVGLMPRLIWTLTALLMFMLIEELRSDGITSIDMGLGDFDYKNDWTMPETVYDSIIPLTLRGRHSR